MIEQFLDRDIAYKGVFYSESLNKYYVSDECRGDGGPTTLGALFAFEDIRGIEDILTSSHFLEKIEEPFYERDWVHLGNIQFSGMSDMEDVHIYAGDIFYDDFDNHVGVIKFINGCFIAESILDGSTGEAIAEDRNRVPLTKRIMRDRTYLKTVGNIFEDEELLNV